MGLTEKLDSAMRCELRGVESMVRECMMKNEELTVLDSGVSRGKTSSIRSLTVNVSSESPMNLSSTRPETR
jgi:hypothetical protein